MLYLYMENSDEEYFTPDEITQEELIDFLMLYKKKYYKYKRKYLKIKKLK